MSYLFFDTETTGLVDYKAHPLAAHQPHLVQLGALLKSEEGATVAQLEFLVKPDGWTIPDEAAAVHGFTTEYCLKHGVPLKMVLNATNMLCRRTNLRVAFNLDYDERIMNVAYHRAGLENGMLPVPGECAMKPMVKLCKLPFPSGKAGYKFPKLIEAYQWMFERDFDKAHSALADTTATAEVFFELKRRKEAGEL